VLLPAAVLVCYDLCIICHDYHTARLFISAASVRSCKALCKLTATAQMCQTQACVSVARRSSFDAADEESGKTCAAAYVVAKLKWIVAVALVSCFAHQVHVWAC
jgi:hypothetical protein